ncbi:DUF7144 family membrane protein [Actinocorallia longicatena]|uniref:DUF7144 domain-containing protein n=1 Tax=Actinocorallia longicatena TaxID=111803 RepID=A0ABP6QDS1_9ACTN
MAPQGARPEQYDYSEPPAGGWVLGFTVFAAAMMIITGMFQAFQGLVAIFRGSYYVNTREYLFEFNVTTWGWINLIIGILVFCAGAAVFGGYLWARAVAIGMAALAAVTNFLFMPYYPIWSIVTVACSILAIFALCKYNSGNALRTDKR